MESDAESVAAARCYPGEKDRDKALVALIQKHFSKHDVVTKIREQCEARSIPCEFDSYI